MSNKEKIIRNLEYICGGIAAIKCIFNTDDKRNAAIYQLLDDWEENLYETMELIEEDYEVCQRPLKSLQ